jgi:peptide/nickel transport system permease protein
MVTIILRRGLAAVPLLFLVSVFAFLLMKAIPGDPVDVLMGASQRDLSVAQLNKLRDELGLNKPLPQQYVAWVSGWWGQGELGRSYRDGRRVPDVVGERLNSTLALVGLALTFAFTLGIGSGLCVTLIGGQPWGKVPASLFVGLLLFLYSAPSFWLAFLTVFAIVRWLPGWPVLGLHAPGQAATGLDGIRHMLLPALLLASRKAAKIALYVKAVIAEQIGRDYVLVARSKGLSQSAVILRHVLKNSLLPVITLLGLSLPSLFGGSVLIETVFGIPGLGRLAVDATFGRNYPVMLALVVIYGAAVVLSNLVADVLYCLVDPRVREELESGSDSTVKGAS